MQIIIQVMLLYLPASFCVLQSNPNNLIYKCNRSIIAGLDDMKSINEESCLNAVLRNNSSLSSPVKCARTCRKGDHKTCYYAFHVEHYQIYRNACEFYCTPNATNSFCSNCQCIPADGVERSAKTVNRQLPGPSIEVCKGDYVIVDVTNHLTSNGLTIHWHGMFQKGYQYYDGVPFVTQCPINSDTIFRYQFRANNSGSHFWHAHTGLNKLDGIFGNFIVRQPPEDDPHSCLYDYDLSTHVLIINDWMHEDAISHFPGRRFSNIGQLPDSILINGKGQYRNQNTALTVIKVKLNKYYRIRMINSCSTVCPIELTIEKHLIHVIATDGLDVEPTMIDSIMSSSGERYDFILSADKPIGCYWIQVRAIGECEAKAIQQLAILCYEGASDKSLSRPPTYHEGLPRGLTLNAIEATACERPRKASNDILCLTDLTSVKKVDEDIFKPKPDVKLHLSVNFHSYKPEEIYQPNQYSKFMAAIDGSLVSATINNISFKSPSSPPLSQSKDIPNDQYCDKNSIPKSCAQSVCTCTHKIDIPLNAIVEIELTDEGALKHLIHPFHLHGHKFYVLEIKEMNKNVNSINTKLVQKMDEKNEIKCFNKPVQKDTVQLPRNGKVILRFRADNPGYWLFHCHFLYHVIIGMELIVKVGDQKNFPPVPKNFPQCGNFISPIEDKYVI